MGYYNGPTHQILSFFFFFFFEESVRNPPNGKYYLSNLTVSACLIVYIPRTKLTIKEGEINIILIKKELGTTFRMICSGWKEKCEIKGYENSYCKNSCLF